MSTLTPLVLLAIGFVATVAHGAVRPPVVRSTDFNGAYSNIVRYPVRAWMNTNTPNITVETWMYARDLIGNQALVARHYRTNLYFGLSGNRLRFYRSGGTFVDSTGTVAPYRWTHVAVTYDGATARFYINGSPAGSSALANQGNYATNSLSLGGEWDIYSASELTANGFAFNGYLDEVRLWSVVRSQAQLAGAMNQEVRSGTGLLATFGTGGWRNDITGQGGTTDGIAISDRESGFGILPAELCIPKTSGPLRVDGNIDMFNEYRGAETMVMRSRLSATRPDSPVYLIVGTNSTNNHLFIGVPDLEQSGLFPPPIVQIMADVNVANGTSVATGDWDCRYDQDAFQGGSIWAIQPPFNFETWTAWGQSVSNWQGATLSPGEFHQSYEFRIHAEHVNFFTSPIGLLARYFNFDAAGDQLTAPLTGITNQPATYTRANWCGFVDDMLGSVSLAGTVTNLSDSAGVPGLTVSLYSGDSELTGFLLASTTTDGQGRYSFTGVRAPIERNLTVVSEPPSSAVLVAPAIDSTASSRVPIAINSPVSVRFASCPGSCTYARVNFRHREYGPVRVTGVTPDNVPAAVVVRTTPLKTTAGGGVVTVLGTNFHPGVRAFLRGSGCSLIPPSLCTSDWFPAIVESVAADGLSLVASIPDGLGVTTVSRSFQLVIEDPSWTASPGGSQWNYGPSVIVTPPIWPQLHGFEFVNRDDHPSVEEFEACYGNSIFVYTPIPIRDPFYGLWAAVYFGWMEGCEGSCYGMAGTSRLLQDGSIPIGTFDVADGDGVHGVRFGNGYLGNPACELGGFLCPPGPARWTGFDLFQPFRPKNLWGRITSLAGAQTSAEALVSWLSQLNVPVRFGPRRGLAAGSPLDVLNRVRTAPNQYTLCVQMRDFGSGHCVTPYAVVDGMGLSADALTPVPAANSSLIKVYDNNWPTQERFIEVNRADNVYRYNSGVVAGIHEGPGLFSTPMSIYRGARHAPDPFFMARYGTEFLRLLITGAGTAAITNAGGASAGWTSSGLSNDYAGALPFLPFGLLSGGRDRFDNTMFFLPGTNAPGGARFQSGGSNVTIYAGQGAGDIAFGFNAPNGAVQNSLYGILISSNQALQAMGVRAGAAVNGFSAMLAHRTPEEQSRVWLIDAGADALAPDVHVQLDGLRAIKVRNNSALPLSYRIQLAGRDKDAGVFEFASDRFEQPANSTAILIGKLGPGPSGFVRELDLNNDGQPDAIESLPARGVLRADKEGGLLALRWRQAARNESLVATDDLAKAGPWTPVNASIGVDGADRIARVPIDSQTKARFYQLLSPGTNCVSLGAEALGSRPNPWETSGLRFAAFNAAGAALAQNTIVTRSGVTGLDVGHTVRIQPLDDCQVMHIDVRQTSGLVTFEAIGPLGTVVARQQIVGPGTAIQRVTLRGFRDRIQSVRVTSPNALCVIANVCCERVQAP